jgi:SAM-dependent methyltransferase
MKMSQVQSRLLLMAGLLVFAAGAAFGQAAPAAQTPFEPIVGQPGKDVVWVPTPEILVEKMLDMAKVTPQDIVVDLGSGDGRNIIAAAKRGARARGVEFNPQMVELSRNVAEKEGVSKLATFVEHDMFTADISDATVLALFLLPDNLRRLRDSFLNLKPGTRIVLNTFAIPEWEADLEERIPNELCGSWCTSLLYYVPAKVGGRWQLDKRELTFNQTFQKVAGTFGSGSNNVAVEGKLEGDRITFTAGGVQYTGRVNGDVIEGSVSTGGNFRATRMQ